MSFFSIKRHFLRSYFSPFDAQKQNTFFFSSSSFKVKTFSFRFHFKSLSNGFVFTLFGTLIFIALSTQCNWVPKASTLHPKSYAFACK